MWEKQWERSNLCNVWSILLLVVKWIKKEEVLVYSESGPVYANDSFYIRSSSRSTTTPRRKCAHSWTSTLQWHISVKIKYHGCWKHAIQLIRGTLSLMSPNKGLIKGNSKLIHKLTRCYDMYIVYSSHLPSMPSLIFLILLSFKTSLATSRFSKYLKNRYKAVEYTTEKWISILAITV